LDPRRLRFETLCAPLRPDLFRFAMWLSRDRGVAEDVVQETLLRAWRSLDALSEDGSAKAWLLTIARREFARLHERKRAETVDVDDLTASDDPALATHDDHETRELRRAIFKLPPEYREPLVMQVLLGLSTDEIGRELGLTNGAVLTRLCRARQQLRNVVLGAAGEGA
jgi:RNA polymerase sigma-70 factor (ECF subfamily)